MWRLAGIFLLLLLGSGSCARKAPVLSGSTMGTTYTVIIPDLQTSHKEPLKIHVDLTLAQINSTLSTYQHDSSIAKFNASKSTDWMVVAAELVTVADAANQIAVDSDGAFDPTIAPLVNAGGLALSRFYLGWYYLSQYYLSQYYQSLCRQCHLQLSYLQLCHRHRHFPMPMKFQHCCDSLGIAICKLIWRPLLFAKPKPICSLI